MSEAVTPPAQRDTTKRLSESTKRAIIASVAINGSIQKVAAKFNVHRNTVTNLLRDVQRNVPQSELREDWRQNQTFRAVRSVDRALEDDSDVYKSATIAVQALKGLGVYAPDQQQANVVALIGQVPAGLSNLFNKDAIDVEATTDSGEVLDNGAVEVNSNTINES